MVINSIGKCKSLPIAKRTFHGKERADEWPRRWMRRKAVCSLSLTLECQHSLLWSPIVVWCRVGLGNCIALVQMAINDDCSRNIYAYLSHTPLTPAINYLGRGRRFLSEQLAQLAQIAFSLLRMHIQYFRFGSKLQGPQPPTSPGYLY
jgi:hypothetical protein